jgi:hypothetical protein
MIIEEQLNEAKPIFVLGSPRSGTSIITIAIQSGANIPGYREGHFLPLAKQLLDSIETYYAKNSNSAINGKRTLHHIDKSQLQEQIHAVFREQYNSLMDQEVWFDKTPGINMIKTVPYLSLIWPKAKFIFAKRRGIECIMSRLRKFPGRIPFEAHCKLWQECMETWLTIRDQLNGHYLEIEQRDISLNSEATANQIGIFLQLEQQKIDRIADIFATKRVQHTGGEEELTMMALNETGWSDEQIAIFRKYCTKISEKFGYTESSSYMTNY